MSTKIIQKNKLENYYYWSNIIYLFKLDLKYLSKIEILVKF